MTPSTRTDQAMKPESWLPFLEEIAEAADTVALRYFQAPDLRVEIKADHSPVSEADRAIERLARERAAAHRPSLAVLGEEEGGTAAGSGLRLIVDPIDGTRNFVRGIPIFATLLAVESEGEIVAGLVSAPALGRRWHAARGAGAFSGLRRLRVSTVTELEGAQVFHAGLSSRSEGVAPGLLPLLARVERSRGFGDFYQHVLVAEGCGEAAVDPAVSVWDVAALVVIVEEAGGRATTLAGARSVFGGSLVTTNGLVHDEVLRILAAGALAPPAH